MEFPRLKRILQWAVLARLRSGGRVFPGDFMFSDAFLHGIEQVLDDEFGWETKHRTNGVGLPVGCEHGLG